MTYSSVCKLLLVAALLSPLSVLRRAGEEDQVVDLEAGRRVVLPELRRALREPRRAEQVSPDRPERASAPANAGRGANTPGTNSAGQPIPREGQVVASTAPSLQDLQ